MMNDKQPGLSISGLSPRLIQILKLALGIGLIGILVASVDLEELMGSVKSARMGWLPLCFLAVLVTFFYQAFLLGLAASPFARIGLGRLFIYTMIGRFFSLFLPSHIGGDVVKGLYLIPHFQSGSQAYAAMVVQRLVGGLGTLFVGVVVGLPLLPDDYVKGVLAGLTVLGVVMVLGAVVWKRGGKAMGGRVRGWGEFRSGMFVLRAAGRLVGAVLAYRNRPGLMLGLFGLSMGTVLLAAVIYQVCALALQTPFSFMEALIAASATMLSVLIPLTPGGIGVGEGVFVLVCKFLGIPAEQSLAVALLARGITYLSSVPGGVFYLYLALPVSPGRAR